MLCMIGQVGTVMLHEFISQHRDELIERARGKVALRAAQRATQHRAGLGLGLAISRQAIEADGGKISLRDIPGKGCMFVVEMPLAVGDPAGG